MAMIDAAERTAPRQRKEGRTKLTDTAVRKIRQPGLHNDGAGLYLRVKPNGAKGWIYRFKLNGRSRDMGLGTYPDTGLAEAREEAAKARKLVNAGEDPIEQRKAEQAAQTAEVDAPKGIAFREAASAYIAAHEPSWRNEKHRYQWKATLRDYAEPVIGAKQVDEISVEDVLAILEPIWSEKPETANRLRGRIESVLDWSAARGYRNGPNPALWRGNLKHLLPSQKRIATVKHHAALPYADMPEFMEKLRKRDALAARALEFCILTCVRVSECLNATWDEFDIKGRVWTIPGKRMKAGKEHRVPLTEEGAQILTELAGSSDGRYVFPGSRKGRPLSNMAFAMLMRRMGYNDITAHGFRSTFRDWSAEQTSAPREIAELCLAHTVGNAVERAYRRSDLFEKRRELLNQWAEFLFSKG